MPMLHSQPDGTTKFRKSIWIRTPFGGAYWIIIILFSVVVTCTIWWAVKCWTRNPNRNIKDFPWQAAAGAVAGGITLITYMFTRQQQQSHFEEKQAHDRFVDVQDCFGKSERHIRANAALRLIDIGMEQRKGSTVSGFQDYPLYARVASQLTTGLMTEDDIVVRTAIGRAIKQLADQARQCNPSMLEFLIRELIEAHKVATSLLIKSMAEFYAGYSGTDDEGNELVFKITQFHGDEKGDWLPYVRGKNPYTVQYDVSCRTVPLIKLEGEESEEKESKLIKHLEVEASRWRDTRQALCTAIKIIPKGSKLMVDISLLFLPGADLSGAWLKEANANNAYLDQANFENATLSGATMEKAILDKVNLNEATADEVILNNANIHNATLTKAQLRNAHLAGTLLEATDLSGAVLSMAKFERADLSGANLTKANLKDVKIENTTVYAVKLDDAENLDACWAEAFNKCLLPQINEPPSDKDKQQLEQHNATIAFLKKKFPGYLAQTAEESGDVAVSTQTQQNEQGENDDAPLDIDIVL